MKEGNSYFPSNGNEGEMFYDKTCAKCYKKRNCSILENAVMKNVHPKQWIYDENDNPTCTSLTHNPIKKRVKLNKSNQLELFK